ncbi:hypothetical protein Pan241w_18650 [Gimesia alba]|uniref:Outer membrane lipoprotein-sorting protein n=1 Tax=Gimesia alba TaxID=2527973 RepID=A0A517RD38_9PLAN|nr:hypothetical protein [Gimesia alba]QDT41801.1 hypothetical protein Pan241w_18650 [Gimesia alba]
MKFCRLLPPVLCCLVCVSVRAESESESESRIDSKQRAIKVLREWSDENLSFTSVRGKFHRIWYDDIFRVQKHADGEFGYFGPRHGFLRMGPPAQKPGVESLKKTPEGKPYEYKDSESEEYLWLKTRLLILYDEEKTVQEWIYANQPKRKEGEDWGFLDLFYEISADGVSPFLPGVPNQARFDDWLKYSHFKVIKETETHIWIAGKPSKKDHRILFSEFKLYLEKRPWRLKAVQYIHPGENQSTVYTYSHIEMNPLEWDEPDLSGYQNPTERPLVARRPELEVTEPEVTKDWAVWNTLIALLRLIL